MKKLSMIFGLCLCSLAVFAQPLEDEEGVGGDIVGGGPVGTVVLQWEPSLQPNLQPDLEIQQDQATMIAMLMDVEAKDAETAPIDFGKVEERWREEREPQVIKPKARAVEPSDPAIPGA